MLFKTTSICSISICILCGNEFKKAHSITQLHKWREKKMTESVKKKFLKVLKLLEKCKNY